MTDIAQIFLIAVESVFTDGRGSQKELAKLAEMDPSYLNRILKGKTPGSDNTRRKIAAALGYGGRKYEDLLEIGRSILAGQGTGPALGSGPAGLIGGFRGDPGWLARIDPGHRFETGIESAAPELPSEDIRFFRLALEAFIKRDGNPAHAKRKNKDALAQASGLERNLLNKIYLGQKEASLEAMEAVARAVDIPLGDFIAQGRAAAERMAAIQNPVRLQVAAEPAQGPEWGQAPPQSDPVGECRPGTGFRHQPLQTRPMPVIGLAACSLKGWERKMPVAVSASSPVFGPRAFAVIATGQSMVPASIGPGMLCYCDPDVEPCPGDAVFVYDGHENACTIKEFLGWGVEGGAKEGWLKLKGWNDPDQWKRQSEYYMEINGRFVTEIATVVCVRRRL